MFKLSVYKRDKNGNRGEHLFDSHYPTKQGADDAKVAYQHLIKNQWKFKKEWNLKNAIVVGPTQE